MVDLVVADGAVHVELGVAAAVVVPVDERHDLSAGVGGVAESVLIEEFAFERGTPARVQSPLTG